MFSVNLLGWICSHLELALAPLAVHLRHKYTFLVLCLNINAARIGVNEYDNVSK